MKSATISGVGTKVVATSPSSTCWRQKWMRIQRAEVIIWEMAVEEEILHEGPMPGAMIYISEFQNKLAWKFDISVSKGQRTQPGNKRVPTPSRSFLALLAGWQLLSPTVSFPFTVGVCVARGCSTWVNTRSDARRHVIAWQLCSAEISCSL